MYVGFFLFGKFGLRFIVLQPYSRKIRQWCFQPLLPNGKSSLVVLQSCSNSANLFFNMHLIPLSSCSASILQMDELGAFEFSLQCFPCQCSSLCSGTVDRFFVQINRPCSSMLRTSLYSTPNVGIDTSYKIAPLLYQQLR